MTNLLWRDLQSVHIQHPVSPGPSHQNRKPEIPESGIAPILCS